MTGKSNEQRETYIKALLSEREGYVRYGNEAGVADIDAELEKVGHRAKTPAQRSEKMTPPKRTET